MTRGGAQDIPRPANARPGGPAPWADRAGPVALDRVERAVVAAGPGRPPAFHLPDAPEAGVLVALFGDGDDTHVVLTRRSSSLRNHRGEVAFPGGKVDPGETPAQAAVREAHEEVGIVPASVRVVGDLDRITTVGSRFVLHPFVGVLPGRPRLVPNEAEIERAFDAPFAELLDPDVYREEVWELPWGEHQVSFFLLEGDTVWGATARILRQLLILVTGAERQ